jgi:hypothetical protein
MGTNLQRFLEPEQARVLTEMVEAWTADEAKPCSVGFSREIADEIYWMIRTRDVVPNRLWVLGLNGSVKHSLVAMMKRKIRDIDTPPPRLPPPRHVHSYEYTRVFRHGSR